ncbi:MAG: radical SAM protein, partial [Lachnospiraceae bacterium]|nr:radical SAM protein [Lachnospiraceae bacterium]
MKDTYGREIDYIRISVTDRCNLRCRYCMPEEGVESISHDRILRFAEIVRIAEAAAALGISKIKLTGGEPLVRRGIVSLVRELKQVPGIREITMTTNGVLLGEMYEDLLDAGLSAVTISLDTLDRKEYARITRRDEFDKVTASLEKVVKDGRIPVKINCVSYRREHPQELRDIALLAKDHPLHVRFIEMMPIGLGKQFAWLSQEDLMEILRPATGVLIPTLEVLGNGPARYYRAEGFAGRIGFISAISHQF